MPIGELRGIEVGFASKQSVAGKLGSIVGKDWYLTGVEVMDMQVRNESLAGRDCRAKR